MARSALLALVLLVVGIPGVSGSHALGGYGLSLWLPRGWHGLSAAGQLQAADVPLGPAVRASAERARVGRGHVHLIVWDFGPSVPYLAGSLRPARPPLSLGLHDLTGGPLEGFTANDAYAARTVAVGGELLELIADLGPKPLAAGAFLKVDGVLATLRVQRPRIVPARNSRLASGGVALRLLAGWSGWIEVPADRHRVQLVLRARRGGARLVLLELPGGQGAHADLPITLTSRNVFHHRGLAIARRVFTSAGRSFDLSAVVPSASALRQLNRLLLTLAVVPRPWTFRSCDLVLRLPGSWLAAVNPRSGCYPVVTLHGPGVRVVLTELRPRESAGGQLLTRSGRRFRVAVTPTAAVSQGDAVLATLKASRR